MATFIMQPKISKAEALRMAEPSIEGIENFFRANPKRRVCNAGLFYGEVYKIKRKAVREQVLDIVQTLDKAGKFK